MLWGAARWLLATRERVSRRAGVGPIPVWAPRTGIVAVDGGRGFAPGCVAPESRRPSGVLAWAPKLGTIRRAGAHRARRPRAAQRRRPTHATRPMLTATARTRPLMSRHGLARGDRRGRVRGLL